MVCIHIKFIGSKVHRFQDYILSFLTDLYICVIITPIQIKTLSVIPESPPVPLPSVFIIPVLSLATIFLCSFIGKSSLFLNLKKKKKKCTKCLLLYVCGFVAQNVWNSSMLLHISIVGFSGQWCFISSTSHNLSVLLFVDIWIIYRLE